MEDLNTKLSTAGRSVPLHSSLIIKNWPIMNDSAPVELLQWADAPYSLIETPKHKEGKVDFTSARVAEIHKLIAL